MKISKTVKARNKREAEIQWLDDGCPGYQDISGAKIEAEEIDDKGKVK